MSRSTHAAVALPNSYWVLPGQLLAGEHPCGRSVEETRARLAKLAKAGIDCFVDLTAASELRPYELELPFTAEYVRYPIEDHGLPERAEHMASILDYISRALVSGRRPYVHCRAGIGRTGMVIGCLLIERGLKPDDALYELNKLWQNCGRSRDWPYVPETDEQIEYVRAWKPAASRPQHTAIAAERRERFRGALVGLATADALAVSTGDGAHRLPRGAWSDDTAMALCLAESLLERDGFDAHDQVMRYERWRDRGHLSSTGTAVGIRPGTARALAMARWRRQAFSGSHDPEQLDPEVLARVAPTVMFSFDSPEEAVREACDQARTTCQAPRVLDGCRLLAVMLHAALSGRPKSEIFAAGENLASVATLHESIRAMARGGARQVEPAAAPGDAVTVLHTALWAFGLATSFEGGARMTVNLGGASDAAGAVYGQLAGAHYGAQGIPPAWRNELMHKELIEDFADRLAQRRGHDVRR